MKILLTLKEIEVEVNKLARLIKAPDNLLPTYGSHAILPILILKLINFNIIM